MDELIILTKIESLDRCLTRIRSQFPLDVEILKNDLDKQDIVVLNLERAIQVCVDIAAKIIADTAQPAPVTMSEGFSLLMTEEIISPEICQRMQKAVGFRNVAVHEYNLINWEIVFAIISNHLDDFRRYAKEVLTWLKAR
jgi:uncharacterized protein YutE (UPF0331/DUF86 family)